MTLLDVVSFVDEGLGNSSYLVALDDARALAIDPQRDITGYRAEAETRGWAITATVETHLHADFISGGRELQAVGSTLYAPRDGDLAFEHRGLEAREEIDLGGLTLSALATPGHTPEHLAYLVSDDSTPLALFSGGSLLVGSVARTDLITPEQIEELARRLFRSLRDVLRPLPDDLPVYPTHGAGSFCTAGVTGARVTTLGVERAANPYLGVSDEDEFVELMLGSLGSYPGYYHHLRERNRRGPVVYGDQPPPLESLTPADLRRTTAAGAVVVDVRPAAAWAHGHLPESLSIPYRDAFAPWLGWMVEIDAPIVFVLGPEQDPTGVVRAALGIGFENLVGELHGGVDAWVRAGHELVTTPLIDFSQTGERRLVDVRQRSEWELGHIPGAFHVELGALATQHIPDREVAVHCGRGERAATAASVLERAGRTDAAIVTGGPSDWSQITGRSLATR